MADIIIIGAGPAGLTAAIYCLRAGLEVILFDKNIYGGQMAISNKIENYPGFKSICGQELSVKLYEQVVENGAKLIFDEVVEVNFKSEQKIVRTRDKIYKAKAVIIASGSKRKKLGCPGEEDFTGKGVSYCATCDGALYKGKNVAIVGGGNTALQDAIFLSAICNKVTLIHRRKEFRADDVLVRALKSKQNIEIKYDSIVESIDGYSSVEFVNIKNVLSKENESIEANALFVAIGMEPDTKIFKSIFNLDKNGYIISDERCLSGFDGVYIAGDCRTKPLRQIVTAEADGASSAIQAIKYINNTCVVTANCPQ